MTEPKMTRRDFFKTSAWATALFAATPLWADQLDEPMPMEYLSGAFAGVPMEWSAPADLADTDPAVLALHRVAFGPRPGEVERVRAMGVNAFIEQQLAPELIPDPTVEQMLTAFPSLTMSIPELTKYYEAPFMGMKAGMQANSAGGSATGFTGMFDDDPQAMLQKAPAGTPAADPTTSRSQSVLELVQAVILRHAYSERQLFEIMVDFWGDHFNIYALKGTCRILKVWDDREVIRKHALGKFRDLLFASAKSPAMLVYLDNIGNLQGIPQENFARELLELHTLGIESKFTQKDVSETARAFTGWSMVTPRKAAVDVDYTDAGEFQFRKKQHDTGSKTVLGWNLQAGRGIEDGEEILERIAAHPKTAEHIAFKLTRRFVSDTPPPALVARAAETFMQTEGDIRSVLKTILYSDEFKTSFGQKVKRPLEFIASSLRTTEAVPTGAEISKVPLREYKPIGARKRDRDEPIARTLRTLGHVPFTWPAPNGYPDVASAWVNSNNLLARWNYAFALTTNRILEFDVALESFTHLDTPEVLVDEWSKRVLNRALPGEDRAKLIEHVRGDTSETRVENLVALLIASPHFQYR